MPTKLLRWALRTPTSSACRLCLLPRLARRSTTATSTDETGLDGGNALVVAASGIFERLGDTGGVFLGQHQGAGSLEGLGEVTATVLQGQVDERVLGNDELPALFTNVLAQFRELPGGQALVIDDVERLDALKAVLEAAQRLLVLFVRHV